MIIEAVAGVRRDRTRLPWSCGRVPSVLAMLLLMAAVPSAHAQQPALGSTGSGLRGLVHTGLPLSQSELNLSLATGYGVTDAFEPVDGLHHRGHAAFGAAFSPMPWLAFALRLDGRLEMHPDDGEGAHSAGFGDPRIFARMGHRLTPELSLGAELGGWFPGTDAPSLEPSASTAEARALLAFTPAASPWALLAAAGFRLDNSARSAPDLSRLRLGDRVSLGVSDSNAVLLALGVARRLGRKVEAFGELSADLLVGSRAPELLQSPLRIALGGRYFVSPLLQLDLTALTSLSKRPDIDVDSALVPIEPRVLVLLGVRYTVDFGARPHIAGPARTAATPEPKQASPAQTPALPTSTTLVGTLVDDKGEPLPEAQVTLRAADGEVRETISNADGRYSFERVPLGPATIEVAATGFQTQSWELDVRADMPVAPAHALVPKRDSGVLRGLIRSFASEPLQAQILVRDRRGRSVANQGSAENGRFEVELPPGSYEVTINAPGFRTHRRRVRIEGNGVSILNVDMREAR